jgi:acetyl esterase/lipase
VALLLRLRDEGLPLPAAAAKKADARLIVVPDAPHVWHYFASWLPEARESLRAMGSHILEATS